MLGLVQAPESTIWREAHHKLMKYQLMCPVRQEFGMDRNPVPYFSGLMRRPEATLDNENQFGTVTENTNLQLHSFLLEQLLGRRVTTANQLLGIPIAWIRDTNNLRTLQATARAALPAANPTPDAVARVPTANTSDAPGETTDFDWPNCLSDLDVDLDYQVVMHGHKLVQL